MKVSGSRFQSKLGLKFNIGIVVKERDAQALRLAKELIAVISNSKFRGKIFIEGDLNGIQSRGSNIKVVSIEKMLGRLKCLISIGGDGTILRCARYLLTGEAWKNCSLLGLNAGHLGFLSVISGDRLRESFVHLLSQNQSLKMEKRHCLQVDWKRAGDKARRFYALNDCVLSKGSISRLFEFQVEVDSEFLSSYRADGLIVSSPTGSTAYNLAAGGAIVDPSVSALQLTPICPQSLSAKPIVISDQRTLNISLGMRSSEVFLTIDGHTGLKVLPNDKIQIRKSDKFVSFLIPPGLSSMHYFQSLRHKLKWGSSLSSSAST